MKRDVGVFVVHLAVGFSRELLLAVQCHESIRDHGLLGQAKTKFEI